jgi:hypothetical protein
LLATPPGSSLTSQAHTWTRSILKLMLILPYVKLGRSASLGIITSTFRMASKIKASQPKS